MTEAERTAWDSDDPFDAMAESFKRQVTEMAIAAQRVTLYRELDPIQQTTCFLTGVLTATIGVAFASIKPEGRDVMFKVIVDYLPQARQNAEDILGTHPAGRKAGE